MASLPHILLENIFSLISYRHLLLVCSRVCKSWSQVILNPAYMPFRTFYHRVMWDSGTLFLSPLLGENGDLSSNHASHILKQLCLIKYNISDRTQCLNGVLNMIEKGGTNTWTRIDQDEDSVIIERLSNHPLYTSIINGVSLKNKNVWSLVTAIAMLSRDTDEILHLFQVLLGIYPASTIMDIFYGYAVIFLFCSQHYHLSNVHHYKVHAALYLTENIIQQPEYGGSFLLSCEHALLINHVPRAGETICVDYVPGVDITGVVQKMVQRHSTLRYLIIESQASSSASFLPLPPNAVRSFSIYDDWDSSSYDVLMFMPDSIDIEEGIWGKSRGVPMIIFRNVLSIGKNYCNNSAITIIYSLMLSLKNQDLCWSMYSIIRQRKTINSYRLFPVSIENYLNKQEIYEDRVLIITSNPLKLYEYCYRYFYKNYDFIIITIDEKLQFFLDKVLNYYENSDGIDFLPVDFDFSHYIAIEITGCKTNDFITWLKTKCIFKGVYHPRFNVIMGSDMSTYSHTMPSFSLVRLYGFQNENKVVTTIINDLKCAVLEIRLHNFFDEENINTFLEHQLAIYNEINTGNNVNIQCVCCNRLLKGEYLALKRAINAEGMVAVRFTCFNSTDFMCARCATINPRHNIFDNLEYI